MSIRRPRGPKPTLKHLAFLEAMTEHPEQSAEHRALLASLLTLRLFNAWVLLGADVADAAAPIVRATRVAIAALQEDRELQQQLTRIVDGILMLRETDASALLPRLAALADLYASRGAAALAADVRQMHSGLAAGTPAPSSAPTQAVA